MIRILSWFFLVLFFAREACPADKIIFDPSLAAASAISPATIISEDLHPHVLSLHPTVGYFSYSSEVDGNGSTANGHGGALTYEMTYSWSEHAGFALSALGYYGTGNYTPGTLGVNSTVVGSSGSSKVKGLEAGFLMVFDPYSGVGFRMPFFIGLNYQALTSSMPSAFITGTTLNTPGAVVGISPRFSVGPLRLEPFFVVTTPFEKAQVSCGDQSSCAALPLTPLPIFGVNFVYKPLELSFFLSFASLVFDTGASYYSIGHTFKF
jgi:hypothetical protein